MNNRPALVAIFAHPDDEAFGPGGTLAIYSKTHAITLICVTRGQSGKNHGTDKKRTIAEIREEELRRSASILGIQSIHCLDYADGELSNNKYHDIAKNLQKIIDPIAPEILMTFEPKGVSGHLDHIAISMITHYLFHKLSYTKELMLYCEKKEVIQNFKNYFIFVPEGYTKDQIDKIIDVSSVWDLKVKAMHEHRSQIKDVNKILFGMKDFAKEECFLIEKK